MFNGGKVMFYWIRLVKDDHVKELYLRPEEMTLKQMMETVLAYHNDGWSITYIKDCNRKG